MPTAPLTYLHPLNPKGGMEPRARWARVSSLRGAAPRAEYGPTGGEGGRKGGIKGGKEPPGAPRRPHLSEAARLPSSKSSPPADSAENCVKLPEARPRLPVPSPPPPLPHSPAEARPGSWGHAPAPPTPRGSNGAGPGPPAAMATAPPPASPQPLHGRGAPGPAGSPPPSPSGASGTPRHDPRRGHSPRGLG